MTDATDEELELFFVACGGHFFQFFNETNNDFRTSNILGSSVFGGSKSSVFGGKKSSIFGGRKSSIFGARKSSVFGSRKSSIFCVGVFRGSIFG